MTTDDRSYNERRVVSESGVIDARNDLDNNDDDGEEELDFRWSYDANFGGDDFNQDDDDDEDDDDHKYIANKHIMVDHQRLDFTNNENAVGGQVRRRGVGETTPPEEGGGGGGGIGNTAIAAAAGGDDVTCWQTRCVELEYALQKFRDQAQTIRELLRDKVGQFCLRASF